MVDCNYAVVRRVFTPLAAVKDSLGAGGSYASDAVYWLNGVSATPWQYNEGFASIYQHEAPPKTFYNHGTGTRVACYYLHLASIQREGKLTRKYSLST